ncbi:hypothetical protein K505DRAFT_366752 [Melanomma pulvis-pyrius CBS 109.77]|uniref:SAC3/GANP/THP3 conserved domain-containing protein n=1 Tax=Melanomma pulvis-pyrius CBS 109.77 TaxID=1314802 RepID=A0A6A6WW32_9PLEO|nr:hypothetical protein K505DRAFT_366752 [Melanomma pulvis-pyrius CBS 109.77]
MSTGRRGRGGDRGGRGGGSPFRGASKPRGTFNGTRTNSESDAATPPSGPRALNGGFRGGAYRGGSNARGDNSRGRGGRLYRPPPPRPPPIRPAPRAVLTLSESRNPQSTASLAITNTTPHPDNAYQARLDHLRKDRPRQRARLIQERRMNPDGPMQLSEAVKLIGICNDMCPEYERVRRIVEDDYKPAECTPETAHGDRKLRVPDESRMVKAYTRSAAGMETELVTDIRSPSACLKTMKHMIARLDNEDLPFLYGWLWDRTRAVRKDLRTQAVDKPDDIAIYLECFEQCARLLLICLHHMSGITSQDYDHQQDVEQLMQTNTSLKERYTDNRSAKIISQNEVEFQAYRLIISIHTNDSLIEHEVQNLPEHLRRNSRIKTALQIYQAGKAVLHKRSRKFVEARQNWRDFWALIQSPAVSYLMACAAEILFNQVRHTVLDTIYRAYRQGNANRVIQMHDWTLPELIRVLGFDDNNQVVEFCQAYGFSFGTTAGGEPYLDTNSLPYSIGPLEPPNEMTPQFFSQFVESKRHRRNLSAVIQEPEQNIENEDSLFISEGFTAKPTDFVSNSGIAGLPNGASLTSADTLKLNPFASPFQPTGASPSVSGKGAPASNSSNANPFSTGAKAPGTNTFFVPSGSTIGTPNTAVMNPNPFGTPSGPSVIDSIGNGNGPPKSGFGLPSFSPVNPLAAKPATTTSPATGQTIHPGLFDASKNGLKFAKQPNGSGPFSNLNPGSPFAPSTTTPAMTTPAPLTQLQTPSSFPGATATEEKPKGVTGFDFFPKKSASTGPALPSFTGSSSVSQTLSSSGSPFSAFTPAPSSLESSQKEDQQRSQHEQERIAKETKEAQDRAAQEAQAQRAKEAIQRAKQLKKEQEEHQRQVQAQQALLAEQARQREERIRQKKEASLMAYATSLVNDPLEGLLKQYVENQTERIFKEVEGQVRWERLVRFADERYHMKQVARARSFFAHWVAMTLKKKRTKHARERRRWLKENAAALLALKDQASTNGVPSITDQPKTAPATVDQPKIAPAKFKKPKAPASAAPRVQKVPKPPTKTSTVRATPIANNTKNSMASSQGSNMIMYKNNKAPIDRTETDWFKLRAAGIDPSKHRKRSFGSPSDEEEDAEADRKRRRKSTSSAHRASLPPPTTDEERLARFRAVREALGKPISTPRAINSTPPVNGSASVIIAQARDILSATSTPKASPPQLQNEFSRSVPGLNLSGSGHSVSAFGKSMGITTEDRPAYWGRQSRFVPQHLYGKGKEAVLEYRNQIRRSTSASTEPQEPLGPLDLSSPIMTQQSGG